MDKRRLFSLKATDTVDFCPPTGARQRTVDVTSTAGTAIRWQPT